MLVIVNGRWIVRNCGSVDVWVVWIGIGGGGVMFGILGLYG